MISRTLGTGRQLCVKSRTLRLLIRGGGLAPTLRLVAVRLNECGGYSTSILALSYHITRILLYLTEALQRRTRAVLTSFERSEYAQYQYQPNRL